MKDFNSLARGLKIVFEGQEIKSFEEIPVYIEDCQPQLVD